MGSVSHLVLLACLCLLAFCHGAPLGDQQTAVQPERRELDAQNRCEEILCAPVPSTCLVTATREPALLVGTDGNPCPVCPVCLDYIAELTG